MLRLLQADSRKSVQVLGEAVGLSASACHRRLKLLEEDGVIDGYRAVLNGPRLGFTMQFFIEVGLISQSEAALDAFEAAVRQNGDGLWLKSEYTQSIGRNFRAVAGFTLIRGEQTDFFGQYRRNSHALFALRYSF